MGRIFDPQQIEKKYPLTVLTDTERINQLNQRIHLVNQTLQDIASILLSAIQDFRRSIRNLHRPRQIPIFSQWRQQSDTEEAFLQAYQQFKSRNRPRQIYTFKFAYFNDLQWRIVIFNLWTYRMNTKQGLFQRIHKFFKKNKQSIYLIGAALSLTFIAATNFLINSTQNLTLQNLNGIELTNSIEITDNIEVIGQIQTAQTFLFRRWAIQDLF